MEIRLLGPIEVIDDQGSVVPLASTRQRLLLAGLCLRAGETTGIDWLVELVWGDSLPGDPVAALQSQMSRLRRRLGPGVPIVTVPGGYRMDAPGIVDAVRFRLLVAESGDGGQPDALESLEAALRLWRGRPVADLEHPLLDPMVSDFVEKYVAAAERRIAALIEQGDHGDAASAAKQLTAIEPFREGPVGLHMEALARAGRLNDALDVYERFRHTLADEVGLDPSAELRAVQRRVLDATVDPTRQALPPVPKTSLVGRDTMLESLAELLAQPGLVTLTGPGGVGKTRLAVEASHAAEARYRDGVWFCDLTALPPGGSVSTAVASALAVDPQPGEPLEDRITSFLVPRRALVVLDNCEHVIDGAAHLVARVLGRAPGVTMLATSRERLRVPTERCVPVDPLLPRDLSAGENPAVRLFCDRASSANPAFSLEAVAEDVAGLCEMLGGLPLAIEIAAARTATRATTDLIGELRAHGGELLAERGRPERHASLHAVVAWSADSLEAHPRALFERLSVFAGGWHADAARAVAGADDPGDIDQVLDALAERSLIRAATSPVRTRWTMLEPVRAYAAHQLGGRGATAGARDRHAEFFVEFAETAAIGLRGPAERHWVEQLSVELANLRAAHRWMLDADRSDSAMKLAAACYPWIFTSAPAEVAAWAQEAVDRFPDNGHPAVVGALATAAVGAWRRGDADAAIELASRGADLGAGRAPASRWALDALGDANIIAGRYQQAIDVYRAAIPLAEEAGDFITLCNDMGGVALGLAYQGRAAEAIAQADRVVRKTATVDNPSTQGWAHFFAGETRVDTEPRVALPFLRRAAAEAERAGNRFLLGVSLVSLVSVQGRLGEATGTLSRYRWLITYWQQIGAWSQLWITMHSLIEALHRGGHAESAAVLHGALRASSTAPPLTGPDAARLGRVEADLIERFGPDRFAELRAIGSAMSDDDAIFYALAALPPVQPVSPD